MFTQTLIIVSRAVIQPDYTGFEIGDITNIGCHDIRIPLHNEFTITILLQYLLKCFFIKLINNAISQICF